MPPRRERPDYGELGGLLAIVIMFAIIAIAKGWIA